MGKKLYILTLGLVMLLLLAGGCREDGGAGAQVDEGGSWGLLSQCSPRLSVSGNAASCGLYVRGTGFGDRIGANLRLQRLEGGDYRTIRLWYGLTGQGELDFGDKCWLNEAGSYRLSAQVWVDELAPVVLSADLKLTEEPPRRPDGEELDYENLALFAFDLPENMGELEPGLWEELIATAQTEADRYYNAAPALLLRETAAAEVVLPPEALERLASALERGELRQLAVELPAGRVCFLDGGRSLRGLIEDINEDINDDAMAGKAGLRISLGEQAGGWKFGLSGAAGGRSLNLREPALVYGRLTGESLQAWEQSAAKPPSQRTEEPLYADLAVLYEGEPVPAADIVYGISGDTEPAAYARILTGRCGEYRLGTTPEYAPDRWYRDYVTYLAGRGVLEPEGFAPERLISRGELAELLYRLAGKPEPGQAGGDEPYSRAIRWAVGHGIMTGFADGSLRPGEGLTRQELLVLLWRYVEGAGTRLPHHREDIRYYDRASIGGFAREAVSAFSEAGLAPRENWRRLAPAKPVTQAEAVRLVALVNQSVLSGLEKFVIK